MHQPSAVLTFLISLGALGATMPQALAQSTANPGSPPCATEPDASLRLACYDRLFGPPPAKVTPTVDPARPAADPLTAPKTPAAVDTLTAGAPPTAQPQISANDTPLAERIAPSGSAMSTFWELGRSDKRKAFVVRTYQPNYVLPLHLTSDINRQPYSPTRGDAPNRPNYKGVEAKFQVSLRVKVAEDLLLPRADLWASYTQRSMWQVWNQKDSAPFRNSDYQPEIMYVVPVPEGLSLLPFGWSWRMVDVGFAHQSNGQSEALSRSWNRLYAGTAFERGDVALQVRFNRRPREGSKDDNPDLTRYIGNTELTASWLPGRSTARLTWRLHPKNIQNGSVQLDWTYPVDSTQPQGLRWYLQLFSGYGESLLDYNHRQSSLGLGVTLFQF